VGGSEYCIETYCFHTDSPRVHPHRSRRNFRIYVKYLHAAAECESDVVTEESETEEEFIPRSTTPDNGTPLDPTMPSFVMPEALPVTDEPAPPSDLPETEPAIEAELHETQQEEVHQEEYRSLRNDWAFNRCGAIGWQSFCHW
jgi:hypothetical protein